MDSLLAFLCIICFSILVYGFISGDNLKKYHLHNCHTIYVPENISMKTIYNNIKDKDINSLKRRAREIGISKQKIDSLNDSEIELKKLILIVSVGNEHIATGDIDSILSEKPISDKNKDLTLLGKSSKQLEIDNFKKRNKK
tara:strand:- start:265 stop:687 length:423 start_codon:yes stop_codon:yes gene_type:complete